MNANVYCTYPKLHHFTNLKSKGQIKGEKWPCKTKVELYLVQETLWWASGENIKTKMVHKCIMAPLKCFITIFLT